MKRRAFFPGVLLLFLAFTIRAQQPAVREGSGANYLLPSGGASLTDTVNAQNEFRIGVQAYNRYAFNEAVLAFERALSFRPGEPLILEWLGRAYYRTGLEDTAIRQWQSALSRYGPSSSDEILLRSLVETVGNRRSLFSLPDDGERYVEAGRYPGRIETSIYFRQPTSILPLDDGTAWVVAYGSNELVRLDVNGLIRQRIRGPLNGFDRPYDVAAAPDGRLYVSEFRGSRVSVLDSGGTWKSYIGSRGIADGMFVGPQNITVDRNGYLYVVDYGNRRISKFDPEGAFLFSFGKRGGGFGGLVSPTGIACRDERVFVADGVAKKIYTFDRNGTYLGVLVEDGLNGPESMRLVPGKSGGGIDETGKLLLADTSRVVLVDPDSSIVTELGLVGGTAVRITGAGVDKNGNILAANFRGDEVAVMTPLEDMASGFFVQIDRVIADSFPNVTVELSVQDRRRRPVLALDGRNFVVTEKSRSVPDQRFLGAAYLSTRYDVSVLMERSARTASLRDDLAAALRDITAAGPRLVSVVSAGETPVRERIGAGASGLAATARAGNYSARWRFDSALRLSATDLLPGEKKRAVVFVGSGSPGDLAFEQYSLSELAAYLANNGIAFYAVIVGAGPAGDELRYLCEETGGALAELYQPSGVGPAIRSIGEKGSGSYALSYRSSLQTNFGRDYLPVEVEVYLLERSGRDRTGYFAPLE